MPLARWLLLATLVLLGACSGGNDDDAAASRTLPSAPPETPTTTTSAPADPYAIPAVIDEAYVNRVLAALDQVHGRPSPRVGTPRP